MAGADSGLGGGAGTSLGRVPDRCYVAAHGPLPGRGSWPPGDTLDAGAGIVAALLGSIGWGWYTGGRITARIPVTVIHVVDGDTLLARFDDGHVEKVRLLGVDTPEVVDPRKPVQCFGPEASAFTQVASLTGRRVTARARRRTARQVRPPARVRARRTGTASTTSCSRRLRPVARDPAERLARAGDVARRARRPRRGRGLWGALLTRATERQEWCAVNPAGGFANLLVRYVPTATHALAGVHDTPESALPADRRLRRSAGSPTAGRSSG